MSNIVPLRPTSLLRTLNTLADDADVIVRRHRQLEKLPSLVRKKMDALKRELFDKLFADAMRVATLSQLDEELIARCNDALALLDPAENYEDNDRDCDLRRGVIKARLAMLIGSFPNGAPSDPEIYVRAMLEHICSIDGFCLPALDAAIHQIVATEKFLPSTSELREALSEQKQRWDRRLWSIRDLADSSCRIIAEIEEMQKES